ncbi:PIG-L family deacetylase [Kitasatospora cineracea]|uniref:PIG-L family deacetylase n=1 Tax=Kitasatospora cineracea TaxID=88074 RepID=UPI00380607E2
MPGAARLVDVSVERAVRQLVGWLREFRPDWVVTHDAHGGMTGHPDHQRTHRLVLLAAALPGRFPEPGGPRRVRRPLCATHPHAGTAAAASRPGRRTPCRTRR